VITKYNDSSCALAGQTGGAIRLSLLFLILFASRQKVWQTSWAKRKKKERQSDLMKTVTS